MEVYFRHEIIKGIVELFALFNVRISSGDIVRNDMYLEQYLSTKVSNKVMLEYLDHYHDYFEKICKNIQENQQDCTEELVHVLHILHPEILITQKLELYIILLEYVIDNEDILTDDSEKERLRYQLSSVIEILALPAEEMAMAEHFVCNDLSLGETSSSVVVIGDFKRVKISSFQTLQKEGLKGKLVSFYVKSLDAFLVRYEGFEDSLTLNKQVVFPERVYFLWSNGVITGDKITPIFYGDIFKVLQQMQVNYTEFAAINVEKVFKGTNYGVQELSLSLSSGQLMAVMGGSGTGKTTLFSILSGLSKPDSGSVYLNGFDLHKNLSTLKHHIGFVPQDDMLIEELTVYDNLFYNTQLCRDDLSAGQVAELVDRVLGNLDLLQIKYLKVGSPLDKVISGGQRKRLNIALEMVREPSVLFVDEPTSGLSSSDALVVIQLLKNIALQGNVVLVNIHQPTSDVFFLFDRLLVLDKNGYAAYFGNPLTASAYFKKQMGFVDAVIDDSLKFGRYYPEKIIELLEYKRKSENGEFANERLIENKKWHELYKANSPKVNIVNQSKQISESLTVIPRSIRQFMIFLKRTIKARLADKQYLVMILGGASLLPIVISFFLKSTDIITHEYRFIENDNIPVYLFISIIVALFLGLIISSSEIFRDLKVLKREFFLKLSPVAYLNSKVLYVCLVNALQMFLYVLIGNSILEIKGLFWHYFIILWLTSVSSSILGLFISSSLKSIISIYVSIPFLLIPQILLAGAILDYDKIHHTLSSEKYVPFYADINISRWAYEALAVCQFTENEYDKEILPNLVEQSKLLYYINFVLPKIETQISYLNGNTVGESIQFGEIKSLMEDLAQEFPETRKKISGYLKKPSGVAELHTIVKKINAWLRIRLNSESSNISLYRQSNSELKREDYYNQQLSEFILKTNEFQKYVYRKEEMIRKFQPGYYISNNKYGRAHYYAPVKRIGNYFVKTWIFNLVVVVMFAVIFYFVTIIQLYKRKI
jgi:ABC-type multidrug transport system ATPase subunit